MNKKGFFIWILSLIAFAASLIPFVIFMFKPSVKNVITAVAFIAVATLLYIIGSKLTTHKKGFTAVHAIRFYKECNKNGFDNISKCKKILMQSEIWHLNMIMQKILMQKHFYKCIQQDTNYAKRKDD